MECLSQLYASVRPSDGAGNSKTGEQSQEQDPGCFYLTVKLGWDFVQPRIVGTLKPQLLVVFVSFNASVFNSTKPSNT